MGALSVAPVPWGPRDYLAFGTSRQGEVQDIGQEVRGCRVAQGCAHLLALLRTDQTRDTRLSGGHKGVRLPRGCPEGPGGRRTHTSVHHPAGVHVLHGAAQLHEVLPHRPLRDQPLLLLEVLPWGRQTDGQAWVRG